SSVSCAVIPARRDHTSPNGTTPISKVGFAFMRMHLLGWNRTHTSGALLRHHEGVRTGVVWVASPLQERHSGAGRRGGHEARAPQVALGAARAARSAARPLRRTPANHAFGPRSENVMSVNAGFPSIWHGWTDSTSQPSAKASQSSCRETRRGP